MSEVLQNDLGSEVPWPTSGHGLQMPDRSKLPEADKAGPAAVDLMGKAVQGAHETLDRVADGAKPAVRQLGERVAAAGTALQAKSEQLRVTRDEWVESARTTVRSKPLTSLAAAVALGAVLARLTRRGAAS